MTWLSNGVAWLLWFGPHIGSIAMTAVAVLPWRHPTLRWFVPAVGLTLALALWPALVHELLVPPAIASIAALLTLAAHAALTALRAGPAPEAELPLPE